MKNLFLGALLLSLLASPLCHAQKKINLFNGKNLKGWVPYLQTASMDSKREFKAKAGVIRLSGAYGYVRSAKQYENYRLSVEWRWPDTLSNSGIFLHTGVAFMVWPSNFECQLWAGKAGDIYCASGTSCDQSKAIGQQVVPKQNPSNEKPQGEWNNAEILCEGNTITVWINGEQQNHVTGISETKGYICLQSEGEAVEFRNVVLTPLPGRSSIVKEPKEVRPQKSSKSGWFRKGEKKGAAEPAAEAPEVETAE